MIRKTKYASKKSLKAILACLTLLACTICHCLAAGPAAKTNPGSSAKQTTTSQKAVSAAQSKLKKGNREFLWKMTSESGATLYLLGTIHVFKPNDYPLPEEMEKALAKAKALIVEVDVSKTDPQIVQRFVQAHGAYPPSDSLTSHISPEATKVLADFCAKRNIPFANLIHLRPWIVGLQVLQLEMDRLGYDSKAGIDLHLIGEANKEGKKVISLETMEFQLSLFASLPEDLQAEDLDLSLIDLAKLQSDAGEMMSAWHEGDDKKLDEIMTRDIREHPELAPVQEKILYERNVSMAQKLEAYLKGGSDTFIVAVGSGHLVGDRSVIELLKKKGYTVTQIKAGDPI